ncbi:MAG: T9SS type A sorting domain-containing protein [Lacibacter sp.]
MKRLLHCLFLFILLFQQQAEAQITSPIIKANFGVDADLRSNFFNGFLQAGNDDWFSNTVGGGGEFVIDTAGAAALLARYTAQPASRMQPFFRGMRKPQFSIVNGYMWIDGIFIRDHHGDDSTVFASGSNKNGMNPSAWTTPISQGIPDKNDILDMYMHVRRAGPFTTDSLWLFGGVSLDNTTGNRYFDFEMYQTDIYYDKPSLRFYGYGPDDGHTAWQFDAAGNVLKAGDIIFTAEYGSSSLSLLEARIWVHQSSLSITPAAFSWGGLFDGASSGASYGYASITPKTAGTFYTGLQCANNTWAGPFGVVLQNNTVATNYSAKQFMEFSVNLSKLGLDPIVIMDDACALPFRRILVKSRASTSFTAELKDFVGPFSFFRAPRAELSTNFPVLCQQGVGEIWLTNPVLTSLYTWSTTNGHIVSQTMNGDTISIDQPGTYIVSQELMDSCGSVYATDTVVITQNLSCEILKSRPENFSARLINSSQVQLDWYSNDYIAGSFYEIERSFNGFDFYPVKKVAQSSKAVYSETDNFEGLDPSELFYRLRYRNSGGVILYSNVVKLMIKQAHDVQLTVNPNPVTNYFKLRCTVARQAKAEISIISGSGAVIFRSSENACAGINEWIISKKQNWLPGQYIVQVKLNETVYRKKVMIAQ